jgi:hypothetical protein
VQGRKRWAKKAGQVPQDVPAVSESVGLLATLFQMKGDYIAAAIYRRKQAARFAYEHPSSPMAYLVSHREMLE